MSITPIFDAAVAAGPSDLWKASPIFPLPALFDHLPEYSMEGTSKADIRNAIRAGEPMPASLADTPQPHIVLRERGLFQDLRDILLYSFYFLTPKRRITGSAA